MRGSSEILILTLALDEAITGNIKIRSDVFVQPMFSNYRTLPLDESFTKILKTEPQLASLGYLMKVFPTKMLESTLLLDVNR